jgi:hypothetical protein
MKNLHGMWNTSDHLNNLYTRNILNSDAVNCNNCNIRLPRNNNNIVKLSIMVRRLCVLIGVKVSDKECSALQNY